MVPTLFFSQLVLVALVWLCVMLHWAWPSDPAMSPPTPEPTPPAASGRGTSTSPPEAQGV
jgi:hypothetical protein